jgi:hypothetical protein
MERQTIMKSMVGRPLCRALSLVLLLLGGCATGDRELQMFVSGDIANAEVIAMSAGLVTYSTCLKTLEPVAMASPMPKNDGLLTVGARSLALQQAVYGPCGSVLAPILLKALGKAGGPFGLFLPF